MKRSLLLDRMIHKIWGPLMQGRYGPRREQYPPHWLVSLPRADEIQEANFSSLSSMEL